MPTQQDVLKINSTGIIIEVYMSGANGKGKTGLAVTDIDLHYWRRGQSGAAVTATPIAGVTAIDIYESNKWQEVDSSTLPGLYQYSVPDGVWVSPSNLVTILIDQDGVSDPSTIYEVRLQAESEDLGVQIAPLGLRAVAIETGLTLEQAIRGLCAISGGDTAGADSNSITFKGMNDPSQSRAIGEQDEQGNRINTVWTL